MATKSLPRQALVDRYSRYSAWSAHEFRNLLCGLDPDAAPLVRSAKDRRQVNQAFVRDEKRRLEADRHVRDAIQAGDLVVLEPIRPETLDRLRAHVSAEEFEALRRAIAHEATCTKSYRVARDVAKRWVCVRKKRVFLDFPFICDDNTDGTVTDALKAYRSTLALRCVRDRGMNRKTFLDKHGLTPAIWRAVIDGDARRADLTTHTPRMLQALRITEDEWWNR